VLGVREAPTFEQRRAGAMAARLFAGVAVPQGDGAGGNSAGGGACN
jgi:hypothetical protein